MEGINNTGEFRQKQKSFKPAATIVFIVINCVMFVITEFSGPTYEAQTLIKWGALYSPLIAEGQWWRFIVPMFLHSGVQHLLQNMLALYVLGDILEEEIGPWKLSVIYIIGGIAGNFVEYYYETGQGNTVLCVGASGAVFAVMGALVWVVIRNRGRIRRMDLKRMLIMLAISVYIGFADTSVAVVAHLGGMAAGMVLAVFLYVKKRSNQR